MCARIRARSDNDMNNINQEYYRTFAAVDLDAIGHNLTQIKSKLPDGVLSLAIVKADAYGHGAVGVARSIQDRVDYFGIAELNEAVELREAGVSKPILVLSYTSPYLYETLIKNELTQTIFNYDDAVALSRAAVRLNKIARVHIAVDTGMSRIGFFCNAESVETVKRINDLPNIYIEGIFSHYACADCENRSTTLKQTQVFENFITALENRGMIIPIKHLCNSAGILTCDKKFNMVRIGIVLYGLYPDECVIDGTVDLKPAMKIVSHVIHVKEVPAGSGVSYGHTYFTKDKTRIATICIGYADGYARSLSNKGKVLINGQFAPVIGRVCMDQLMVDVTHLDNVSVGDEVVILGQDGSNSITAEELASLTDTINYEVVCQFQKRVTILQYRNGERVN